MSADAIVTAGSGLLSGAEAGQLTNKERRLARKTERQALRAAALETTDDGKTENGGEKRKSEAEFGENGREVEGDERAAMMEGENVEDEAVSHKEQRKRRKLEKQQAKRQHRHADGGADEDVATYDRDATPPKVPIQRSPFALWIGNLSFNTSSERLQEWFESRDVQGISRIHMPKGVRKMEHNRGFAYVDVPSTDTMKRGIALSEGNLDGRRLLIKAGSDFGGRPKIDAAAKALAQGGVSPVDAGHASDDVIFAGARKGKTGLTKTAQKILRAQKHPPGPTLFFGNLSFSATEEVLRQMIERAAAARFETEKSKIDTDMEQSNRKKERRPAEVGQRESASESEESTADVDREHADGPVKKETDDARTSEKEERNGILRGAGIRKVRMGEFEDTGKCKGFAFVDFHDAVYSTATLIDPRISHLDGRELSVQYAGAEAIRRGAPKGRGGGSMSRGGASGGGGGGGGRGRVRAEQSHTRTPYRPAAVEVDRETLVKSAPLPGTFDSEQPMEKKHKETKEERIKRREGAAATGADSHRNRRLKPGAALASAQRGKVAIDIDAPKGQKMTFTDDG